MWKMETVFPAIWRNSGIKRQIRLELRIQNVFRFLSSPTLYIKLDSCIWCNTSKCFFVITSPGLQVSMCIIGVHYAHIRGSCLSHILHLRAPPTRRAHLYANANDLCLIYPAVWHFFSPLSLSSEKVKLLKDNYCNICHSRSFFPPPLLLQHRGRILSINCIIRYQSFLQ